MNEAPDIVALLVAAGTGSRSGGGLPKQYRKMGGTALIVHAVDRLRQPAISAVRTVIGRGQEEHYREAFAGRDAPHATQGGAARQDSVRNGLEAIATDGGADLVLIHDAARPLVPAAVIDRLIAALEHHDGAVPVLPVVDSLARAEGLLGSPVPRDDLVRVQTPQAFRFDAILAAHRAFEGEATDDAQVARAAGLRVAMVEGDPLLEKITYEEDFARFEQRAEARMISRTGLGFDVHAFSAGDHLWLGGLRIPHERGLSGHSDADVALHALTDALLGAIGAGDIGDHFPPSDPQWRGAASSRFVEHARSLIEARGGHIDHVDLTIICERPKMGPHKEAMRTSIAALLSLPEERVSVKATTTERLGFTGRGEGIAAQCVATIRLREQ